jgi:hypothetical protein
MDAPEATHAQIPESPSLNTPFLSPDHHPEASSSRLHRYVIPDLDPSPTDSYRTHPSYPTQQHTPRFLTSPTPATLLPLLEAEAKSTSSPHGKGNTLRTALILRHAIRWGVDHGEVDLIAWLAGLTGSWVGSRPWLSDMNTDGQANILDEEVGVMEDEDGWGLAGMAIQYSCGRQDKEEGVRTIVGRWGLKIGPREGCDRSE